MATKVQEPDLSEFITTRDISDRYGIPQADVQKAIRRGLLPAQKVGYFYLVWGPNLEKHKPESWVES